MPGQWAPLHLHGVANTPSLVSKLLATLPGKSFIDHLKARHIRKVILTRTVFFEAMLVPILDKEEFDIFLAWTEKSSVENWLISIGHELGHTFAYGIKLTPPLQRRWPCSNSTYENEEEFCEQFGIVWAALDGSHPTLQSLLSSQQKKGRAEVLTEQNDLKQTLLDFSEAC